MVKSPFFLVIRRSLKIYAATAPLTPLDDAPILLRRSCPMVADGRWKECRWLLRDIFMKQRIKEERTSYAPTITAIGLFRLPLTSQVPADLQNNKVGRYSLLRLPSTLLPVVLAAFFFPVNVFSYEFICSRLEMHRYTAKCPTNHAPAAVPSGSLQPGNLNMRT